MAALAQLDMNVAEAMLNLVFRENSIQLAAMQAVVYYAMKASTAKNPVQLSQLETAPMATFATKVERENIPIRIRVRVRIRMEFVQKDPNAKMELEKLVPKVIIRIKKRRQFVKNAPRAFYATRKV